MTADRPLLGILLMLCFCLLAPMGDAVAKLLSGHIPLGQLLLVRFTVQAAILMPLVIRQGGIWRMSPRLVWLTTLRTLLHMAGIAFMFSALKYLPLADAVAIAFVMPFIMLMLGRFVLKEEVGFRRLAACAVGFAGTLLVIQPSFASVGWPALLPLGVAVIFALFMLVTRQLAKDIEPVALQAVSGVIATGMMLPVLLAGTLLNLSDLHLQLPNGPQWALLAAIGLLGTAAHLVMTWSLRFAPASTLAPMQYLEIPVATLVGWIVFHDLPNAEASLGICITIAAGLYIVARENAMARAARRKPLKTPA
ncbi:DMT family transporter [Pseudodonghicola flavimaris]|uniref:DMT family transporter n=1 Tax=Pseudodonghicola flavimaris TaxID=3050036 RepID=A0ABT7EUS7_9RHOB|nr:DMT family transporter [Pseudodonghicola flavimaris]MDK3016101.1 DMT family transporter [Pseudodonghicola flavimaris]